MADDEKDGSGDEKQSEGTTPIMFDDVAQVLDNAEPANLCSELDKVFEKRKKTFNQAKAGRLHEEAERTLRELPQGELDELEYDWIVRYFGEYDPEPLLSRLISGPPLSRAEQLLLASALAGLASKHGGHYRRVLKKVPNRRGRPHVLLESDEMILWADRVKEAEKTENKRSLAVAKVAKDHGISERKLWDILSHEEWAREFYGRERDEDE